MKAILVINEMPDCCSKCELCLEDKYADYQCAVLSEYVNVYKNDKEKLKNCPLKPLPQPKKLEINNYDENKAWYVNGYNECLCEILGETK